MNIPTIQQVAQACAERLGSEIDYNAFRKAAVTQKCDTFWQANKGQTLIRWSDERSLVYITAGAQKGRFVMVFRYLAYIVDVSETLLSYIFKPYREIVRSFWQPNIQLLAA